MSKRSNVKRMTRGARVLRFLRDQADISLRKAAALSGVGDGVIAHLETGRIDIHERHLERLLPTYKATRESYEMFASGRVELPQNLKAECLRMETRGGGKIAEESDEEARKMRPSLLKVQENGLDFKKFFIALR